MFRLALWLGLVFAVLLLIPTGWMAVRSAGRIADTVDAAPTAPVVIVFGAQLEAGGTRPRPFLAGRLDVAAELVAKGKARAVLITGDANGSSGDEIAAMRAWLTGKGVDPSRIVADPHGLDTYDSCRRAREVYGVRKALLVSQSLHLPRAVTLCRHFGIDARGVAARCDGCRGRTLFLNRVREIPAGVKMLWEILRDRPPAVRSEPDPIRAAAGARPPLPGR